MSMSHRSSLNELSFISLIKQDQSNHATSSLQAPQLYRPGSRPISPPPHIVGQIVSPQQVRIALAATDTGLDVQAALETLLSNGAGDTSTPPPPSLDRDYEARPPPRRPPNQRVNSTRDRELPRGAEREIQQPQELNV
jgi:hypothetical protein